MKKYTLNFSGKIFSLEEPIVMGILNVTPDSFFDGGKYQTEKAMVERTAKMISEGASIIDVGACSTRPGSQSVSESEEQTRVNFALSILKKEFPDAIFSVDTFRSKVAETAIHCGASMINDVSGGDMDGKMMETVARLKVPYVLMHMQGTPDQMQKNPYYEDVTTEILRYLGDKINKLKSIGVTEIIIDPGFGFGKTVANNYELLNNLVLFHDLGCPIMAGISRKSMVNKVLNVKPENALNGTTALHTIALMNGANILRCHDVAEAIETIKLVTVYNQNKSDFDGTISI